MKRTVLTSLAMMLVLAPGLAGCRRTQASMEDSAQPPRTLVDYSRSGGFAGMQDHLVVDEMGTASVRRRDQLREFQIEPDRLSRLRVAFDAAGFSRLEKEYLARGADLFTYKITYQGHTVTAMDSAVPASLEPLIRLLNETIERSGVSMR